LSALGSSWIELPTTSDADDDPSWIEQTVDEDHEQSIEEALLNENSFEHEK
jgi:hypothetical protein